MAGFPNKGSSSRGMKNRVLTGLIIRLGRFSGRPLPLPESTSLISTDPVCKQVLAWLEDPGNCVFQSYVSQALRLVEDLEEQNGNLNGLWLIVGSEPLTEKKKARMESSGARVYPRYAATELGTIAMGCGNPKAADEMHLMSDLVALVQDVEQEAEGSAPLYLSSLDRVMPRILLNTQLGDTARVFKRECGCAFEQLGFDTHLAKVRSSSRFTAGGMAVPRTLLEEIIDDTLTVRYGGSSLDYQFVELENKRGHTSLQLRVSPRLGLLDEESIVRDLLTELRKKGEGEELMADMWGRANLVSVARINPESTGKGKIVPVLKER